MGKGDGGGQGSRRRCGGIALVAESLLDLQLHFFRGYGDTLLGRLLADEFFVNHLLEDEAAYVVQPRLQLPELRVYELEVEFAVLGVGVEVAFLGLKLPDLVLQSGPLQADSLYEVGGADGDIPHHSHRRRWLADEFGVQPQGQEYEDDQANGAQGYQSYALLARLLTPSCYLLSGLRMWGLGFPSLLTGHSSSCSRLEVVQFRLQL